MLAAPADDPVTHFLILCLRGRFDTGALDEARDWAVAQELDWRAIDDLATRASLAPILYALLRKQTWFPADILQRWHRAYLTTALINTLSLLELARIGDAFGEAGIPFITLKGAALLGQVYKNVALRPMADLDLLVHREHMAQASGIIQAMGYAPSHEEEHPGMFLAYENEIALQRPGTRHTMIVELHWSLIDSPYYQERLPMAWFWKMVISERVGELTTLILGPEATLLHLTAHLMLHHQGKGLRWLHDIAEVICHFDAAIDWDLLLKQASDFRLTLPVQQALPVVATRWRAPVPTAALEALARLEASPEEQRIFAQMTRANASPGRRLLRDLSGMSGRRRRMRFLWLKLFPSPVYMQRRYGVSHPGLTLFYYPYRWLQGLTDLFRGGKHE